MLYKDLKGICSMQQKNKKQPTNKSSKRHHSPGKPDGNKKKTAPPGSSSGKPNKKRKFSKGRRPGGNSSSKRSGRNRYTSKLTSIQAIFSKHDNLLENYLNLRAKYFDYFFKAPSKQRNKVIQNYNSALEHLRNFTNQLSDYQKKQLEERHHFKLDTTYSINRNLDPELTEVSLTGEERDVHLTKDQLSRPSFSDDQEESSGTIEDYNSYKGI